MADEKLKFEIIRDKEGIGDISIALLRTDSSKPASHVYEIHNDNGMIKTTIRDLKDFKEDRWKHQFDVGAGKSCSIEFDGYWLMDSEQKYNLITESKPYIFWTDNADVLYIQKWDDISSRQELATDVKKVCSIRGWKSIMVADVDQGLICAYIKNDDKVYYRTYAQQIDLSFAWENEREIIEFTPPVQNIGLFRTIDYRTGFTAESNGSISWALTKRAWAGMALPPENISVGLTDYTFRIFTQTYQEADYIEDENIPVGITDYLIRPALSINPVPVSITNVNPDVTHLTIQFSHAVTQSLVGLDIYFTVKDDSNITYPISATSAGANQTQLILTTSNFSSANNPMTVTYDNMVTVEEILGEIPKLTCNSDGLEFAMESFVFPFTADVAPPQGNDNENISVGLTDYTILNKLVFYKGRYGDENVSLGLANYQIIVTKTGSNPL